MQDVDKLAGGYILVFIYVNLMLSKLNFVQQRFWLSVVGILRWEPCQDQQQLSSLELGLRLKYRLIKLSLGLYSKSPFLVSSWAWFWATESAHCLASSTPLPTLSSPSSYLALELITSSLSPKPSKLLVCMEKMSNSLAVFSYFL